MKKVILISVSILAIVVVVAAFPFLYNHYIFSLARLKNSISIGDEYPLVVKMFEEYQEKYGIDAEIHMKIESSRLFIYHVSVFDDCQLTVNFDNGQKVSNVQYIGD